ncbi:hypothetical protein ASE95_05330 [Sphingomonas sp. Leaf231]|uniref:hypothetical protein n=1 Tax=Sphingomonas sp. Leaf231 TaxID=1736301 RepID=UPI0006F332D8|nr:hypothetical protein [Sphingomonas sp. Leaf231]KQN94265.1 hypothetical protein ASE95_05330 [Sphingomonas sp. Leaf231]
MTIGFAGLLSVVWRLFRRDAALVLPIVGTFVFLPAFAALLLCDPVPPLPPAPRDEVVMEAWMNAVALWGQGNGIWFLLAEVIGTYGIAAIALFLLEPDRLTIGQSLGQAIVRLVAFTVATMAIAVPVALGLWMLVLPGLYLQARLIVAVPAMARHPALRPIAALRLSWKMTKGLDRALTGALVALFLGQWFAVSPLLLADETLRGGATNPLALALVDALIAGVGTVYALATLLLGVVAYRVRASKGT